MMRYRATLVYDGAAYQGFQRQIAEVVTIQATVEQAIANITGGTTTVIGAGRTDAGVHASGQVIAFDVEWQHGEHALLRAINANLPQDIALQDIQQVEGFHPRFDARARLYRYRLIQSKQRQPLLRNRSWHLWGNLDGTLMQAGAAMLIGRHDFATFGYPPQGENTVRTIFVSEWVQTPDVYGTLWTYTVEADAFLQHMVRRIVWMLVRIGQGKLGLEAFEATFRAAKLPKGGSIAPAHGLTLEYVRYAD